MANRAPSGDQQGNFDVPENLTVFGNFLIGGRFIGSLVYHQLAASDETSALVVGDGVVSFRAPAAFRLTNVRISVNVAPVGSAITVQININGNDVLSTRATIDASELTSVTAVVPPVIDLLYENVADDALIRVDLDTVGSGTAGAGLKVTLIGRTT